MFSSNKEAHLPMKQIEKIKEQNFELMNLCEGPIFISGSLLSKLELLTHFMSTLLNVTRVSVWKYNRDRREIKCRLLYDNDKESFNSGMVLSVEDYPSYFEALKQEKIIVADQARTHQATSEFTKTYLTSYNIQSMLDVPIYSSERHNGILCLEHTGDLTREWTANEVSIAINVADKISLAIEHEAWQKATNNVLRAERIEPLSGLENRWAFQQRIEDTKRHDEVQEQTNSKALIILGVDRFKRHNDELGYTLANEILQIIAGRLSKLELLENYFPARVGGDLFALWIPSLETEIIQIIDTIEQSINQPVKLSSGDKADISSSMGVSIFEDFDNNTGDPIRKAEIALAKAKKNGPSSSEVFDKKWHSEFELKKSKERDLLNAIKQRQFIPFYQPIINTDSQRVVGVEALVRWQHPNQGVLSPFYFLSLANELGVLSEIEEIMMISVMQDIAENNALKSLDWVSINISPDQIYNQQLTEKVRQLIAENNIPNNLIEFEIVEDWINKDIEFVTKQMASLDDLGIRLSIDDFGTGYSSLSRLKSLPVSKLKIDKCFVNGLPNDESDRCISSSIIKMAQGLKLSVVAEGVETLDQLQWLQDQNCEYIQGYYFSHPLPLKDVAELILSDPSRPWEPKSKY